MRSILRSRRTIGVAAFAGTLAVVAGVSVIALNAQADPLPAPAQAHSSVAVAPAASVAKTDTRVKTTPEGLLVALLDALPEGKTSNYAGNAASEEGNTVTSLMAQTYLDKGRGPGMLRLSIEPGVAPDPGSRPSKPLPGSKSWTQKDGDVITVFRLPDNCVQDLVVYRQRPDGVILGLNVASCLAWDGQSNQAARPALSQKQAIAVLDDERLDLEMSQELVDEGAERFPDLPSIS